MRRLRSVVFVFGAALALMNNSLNAQTDFFWSFSDLNSGAVNSDAEGIFQTGETGSIYLYYSTNGPADSDMDTGAFLDVFTSQNDVIEILQGETFDFAVTVNGSPFKNRWLDLNGDGGSVGLTGSLSSNGQFLNEWHAFRTFGSNGILESQNGSGVFLDQGYDSGADAFLFGRIDFMTIGEGSVNLITTSGDGQIVNDGQVIPATFGNATFVVGAIPEPTSTLLLATMGLAFLRRQR